MDSKETPLQPSHQQLQAPHGFIDYSNPSAGALTSSTSTSQPIHQGLPFGSITQPRPTNHQQQPMDQSTLETNYGTFLSSLPTRFGIELNQIPQEQQPAKRKRGRPRKYILDGDGEGNANSADPPAKRARVKPPHSGLNTLETSGFTPHIIEVEIGEDIASKVMEFSDQLRPRTVLILSASGAISNVTLIGTAPYEGRFEIITLSGLFSNRSGSLKVAVANCHNVGQIVGGVVNGSLIAATKVQVIVASFVSETKEGISIENENSSGQNNEPANKFNSTGSGSQAPSSGRSEQNESVSSGVQPDYNNNNNRCSLARFRNNFGVLLGVTGFEL